MTIDRQWGAALGGSLAVHVIGVVIAILLLWQGLLSLSFTTATEEEPLPIPKEREITMLIPEKIIVEEATSFVEGNSNDSNPDAAPENASIQSNTNMRAASIDDPVADEDETKGAQSGRDAANVELDNRHSSPEVKAPVDETVTTPEESPEVPKAIGDNPETPAPPEKKTEPKPVNSDAANMRVRTAVDGAAEKTGESAAVDAEATPRGKYMSEVKAAIAKEWHKLIEERGRPTPGILKIRMSVSPDGSIADPEFIEDSADRLLKDIGLSAVLDAKVPEMPDEVKKTLKGGSFIVDYEFVSF